MVEQEGYGMREDPAQQSACQVPHVARPYPLYGVKLGKLRKGGVYAVGKPTEEGAFLGAGSLSLKEYGARRSTPMPANSCLVFGEW